MAWLPMYLDHADVGLLLEWLSSEDEIAFLVPSGVPQGWKAVPRVPALPDGTYVLWHVPGGPLPIFQPSHALLPAKAGFIEDPWSGWVEPAEREFPNFGAGCPATFHFKLRVRPVWPGVPPEGLGLSGIEWIGNHYKIIGNGANEATERWWRRLKGFAKKHATRVPRGGPLGEGRPEIWAFPGAQSAYREGRQLATN